MYISIFLLMLRISLEILIFRYSAQILLENALFCRQNAQPKNRVSLLFLLFKSFCILVAVKSCIVPYLFFDTVKIPPSRIG